MNTLEPLPPVPSPPEHYWRQFRINILPILTFVAVLAATVWLWGKNLANPMVMGQAESLQADVVSPIKGRIVRLNVTQFQEVKAGDVIAAVETIDSQMLTNSVAIVRAELEALRANAGLDAGDRVRLADFQLGWMISRADLTTAQARLNWAEAEYERVRALAAEKFSSQQDLEVALRDRDQIRREVEQRTIAVTNAEKAWRDLNPDNANVDSPGMKSMLTVAEEKLRLAEAQLQPTLVTAPIDGCVSKLNEMTGSVVIDGDPIATIANPTANRIVGYLSQPLRIEPKVGMKAEIRSRGLVRTTGETQVTLVGPRIELFDAPLRIRGMGAAQERGLPIVMGIPPNMHVRPGELVDIRLLIN